MNTRTAIVLLSAVTVVSVCGFLAAGPLNPPTGPISSGGKTTQEIYDAVTNISGSIGSVGGRGPAVPGNNYGAGSFTISTTPPVSGPILGLRYSLATPYSYNGPGGTPIGSQAGLTSFTVVREVGAGSATLYRAATALSLQGSATVTVPSAGGATTFALSQVYVFGMRQYNIQRADGTFANIEEIDLVPYQVRETDPSGATWNFNFPTHTGGT